MKKLQRYVLVLVAAVFSLGVVNSLPSYATVPGANSLVNVDSTGTSPSSSGNQLSRISEDGNIVAWTSSSHNIIPSDAFSSSTATVIYKKDIRTGSVTYATPINTGGSLASIVASNFAMSRSGRYFAYYSANTNIVSSPTIPSGGYNHIYLTDTQLGTTVLVDQSATGILANGNSESTVGLNVSDDGRFVTFMSEATNLLASGNPSSPSFNYYIKDMKTNQVINPALSSGGARANGSTSRLNASCDGSIFAFNSNSTNLTPQDNGNSNVYLLDLRNGYSLTNLSYAANQNVGVMSMSCNGRYLVVTSLATNLTTDSVSGATVHYFRYDRLTGSYSLVDKSTSGYISNTTSPTSNTWGNSILVSDDGKVVFFSSDHNMVSPAASNNKEVYLRNPETGITELVPINSSGIEQNVSGNIHSIEINAMGDFVLYNTNATNLVTGMTTGTLKLVLSKLQ